MVVVGCCWLLLVVGRCWLLVVVGCCWLLLVVVGCWLLVVVGCCWLLVVVGCCWLLVVGVVGCWLLLETNLFEKQFFCLFFAIRTENVCLHVETRATDKAAHRYCAVVVVVAAVVVVLVVVVVGCWLLLLLVVGCWLLLVVGCSWLLLLVVVGCCWLSLVVGVCWLLVVVAFHGVPTTSNQTFIIICLQSLWFWTLDSAMFVFCSSVLSSFVRLTWCEVNVLFTLALLVTKS